MNDSINKNLNNHEDVLNAIVATIDIPEHLNKFAIEQYKSIGEWLNRDNSIIERFSPEVFPQGSFSLGTVIRPVGDSDQYDIDLVCKLFASKNQFTMAGLKSTVGTEIIEYAESKNLKSIPKDNRRCWTLEYSDRVKFHMDILPAIPDEDTYRLLLEREGHLALATDQKISVEAIAITDNMHPYFYSYCDNWPVSNPKGYINWFSSKQEKNVRSIKFAIMEQEGIYASIDDIPHYKVKTPLQRAIQLLKRHRDTNFDSENKPISIIITTLSAQAYKGETTIGAALRTILRTMEDYIEQRNGRYWIPNPVFPSENFADKWAEVPEKKFMFFEWLQKAQIDFGNYLGGGFGEFSDDFRKSITESTLSRITPLIQVSAPAIIGSTDPAQKEVSRIKHQDGGTKPWCW